MYRLASLIVTLVLLNLGGKCNVFNDGHPAFPRHTHFSGMFRDGEKHGSGYLRTPEGDTLEGEWVKSTPQEGAVS